MADLDFPNNPVVNQLWTSPVGTVYVWNGTAWAIGIFEQNLKDFDTIGGLLAQVRVLLMDTDTTGAGYRYTTASLITNLNQGLLEMFRLRPDLFLERNFIVPQYDVLHLVDTPPVEQQYVPLLIYYVVGLTQLRDDEQNQDARAVAFMKQFSTSLLSVAGG